MMSTPTDQLIALLTHQLAQQKEQMELQKQQIEQQEARMKQQQTENRELIQLLTQSAEKKTPASTPNFAAFDSSTELWTQYSAGFTTFIGANSIAEDKTPQLFLTNQSTAVYKQLSDWAEQQTPKKEINKLTIDEVNNYIMTQYNPRTFIIRERYRFWHDMKRKPGETISELAARIRHDATTCDFSSITDPQDEALRTKFICSVENEGNL